MSPLLLQIYRVELFRRDALFTQPNNKWVMLAHQIGIASVTSCSIARLFFLKGDLDAPTVEHLVKTLLADPVTEDYRITRLEDSPPPIAAQHWVDVTYHPGVTDTVAENLLEAAHRRGITGLEAVATGQRFLLEGELSPDDLTRLAEKALSNPTIQHYAVDASIDPAFVSVGDSETIVEIIPIRELDDAELLQLSQTRRLSLDLAEMQAIQNYFRDEQRDPTDLELEMLAQTWSEHCIHKTFKATIIYNEVTETGTKIETIHGLLKTYIRAATDELKKEWVYSAFVDNAGIIAFNEEWDLAFKVETHNHPSAIEPFGGANTGLGGVIRDVLGVSARPIASTDVLCFGYQDLDPAKVPAGSLHPRHVQDGVVHGIEDYGNKMGIPTVNGAILYHAGYTANPLVFCGSLGLLPHNAHPTKPQAGDYIVVIGGRTGRDGLRGATFSSMEMDSDTSVTAGSAVQIGHPINEKQVQEVILQARDEGLYHAITDCGAGGLSSAVGEMSAELGGNVQLKDVLLKYQGLQPWEIWLSEAQERMVLAVAPSQWERLREICVLHDVEATCIGTFEDTQRLTLYYIDEIVGDVDVRFLHDGIPTRQLTAVWEVQADTPSTPSMLNAEATLLKILAHPNVHSKEDVIRRYDHEVQGGTCVKPLVGVGEKGAGNASVIIPLDSVGETKGVVLSNGVCPQYGEQDPYAMAWAAIDEAFRNAVAVGADPDQIAILDNFCWGNPLLPDRLGSLVQCAKGCYDAALAYGTPFVSGKDSLNNEYNDVDGSRHAIPGTLLISAVGIVPDIQCTITMDFKQSGNIVYLVGQTRDELGGSHYHLVSGGSGGRVPQPNPNALDTMRTLHQTIQQGLMVSCHDCSEGGVGVALAEMCIGGAIGAKIDLPASELTSDVLLFSETQTRFLVEVHPDQVSAFEAVMGDVPLTKLGIVGGDALQINASDGEMLLSLSLPQMEQAWRGEVSVRVETTKSTFSEVPAIIRPSQTRRVLILHAKGTNRDREAALACEQAGGQPEIVYLNQVLGGEVDLLDYHMLVLPGGFSYGDDLGAGVLWASELTETAITRFIDSGRPVLGICNGFQVLVKANLLGAEGVTLTHNQAGRFECRWVYLQPTSHSRNIFTEGLNEPIYCPVAHGEGRIAAQTPQVLDELWAAGRVPLTYVDAAGGSGEYPANPNGSPLGVASLCNAAGNVMGLMPHPEDHIFAWQHPRWHRGEGGMLGIRLFQNAIKNA